MKIPKKLDYACRVLLQLARRYDTGSLSQLDELAQCEGVSSNFLAQILTDFRKSGLIDSRRGKDGGYILSRPPATISLYEIIVLMEGSVLEYCTGEKGASSPNVLQAWKRLETALSNEARSLTLDKMLEGDSVPMYFI